MDIENILIEGSDYEEVFGIIEDGELDISCSSETLFNKNFFLTIYMTDDELHSKEKIGSIEMTYIDVCMAEEIGWDIFDLVDSD